MITLIHKQIIAMAGYYACGAFIIITMFLGISEINADSANLPHSAASDLGLHSLPMSLLSDARLKGSIFLKSRHFLSKKGLIN